MALSKGKIIIFVKLFLASAVFCALQCSYDYWEHTTAYHQEQQKAREELNHRFQAFKANLGTFLTLAAERIAKQSQNPQRIQYILFFLQTLPEHVALPPLQRVSFKTPRKIMTRFGVLPLSSDLPTRMERSQDLFLKDQGAVMIKRHPVLNKGDPLGWLEVELAVEDLITYLRPPFQIRVNPPEQKFSEQQEDALLKPLQLQNIPSQQGWFRYCHFFM